MITLFTEKANIIHASIHVYFSQPLLVDFIGDRVVKSADISLPHLIIDHLTAVSGVGSSPTQGTCVTSQVLLAGVSGVFLRVLQFSPHLY